MRLERLLGIIFTLLYKDKVTITTFAEKYGVSKKTISRDIDVLCYAGIPIVSTLGRNGGISISDQFMLERNFLSRSEFKQVVWGLKVIQELLPNEMVDRTIQKVINKKTDVTFLQQLIIEFTQRNPESFVAKIELIRKSIRIKKQLSFDYYSPKGKSFRTVEAYSLLYKWSSWYLSAYCLERQSLRLFKINRMCDMNILTEDVQERASLPDLLQKNTFLKEDKTLIALFDDSLEYALIEEFGQHSYTRNGDKLYLETRYTNESFILSWILGFGDKVEIIYPTEMTKELLRIAKSIQQKYLK